MQTSRRRNEKNIKRTEALFPRYLFISLDKETDNWSPIRSTFGVTGIVRFGGMPADVPGSLIDNLKKNELKQGDKVEIINGPFEGRNAVYQKMKSTERVSVLLDIVGINTQVILSVHELEIA